MSKKQIGRSDLESIVRGACFMASSGGGTYSSGMNIAENFVVGDFYKSNVIDVIDVEDLNDTEYAVMVGYIGSPESMGTVYYPKGIVNAVKALEKEKKVRISYILPPEIGAISTTAACTAAAALELPVVNCDGAGRAVPELSMTVFSLYQENVNPVLLASEEHDHVCLSISNGEASDASSTIESLVRPILSLPSFNQKAGLAMWVLEGKEVKKIIKSKESVTNCIELGQYIEARDKKKLFAKVKKMKYFLVDCISGKNIKIQSSVGGGFDTGLLNFIADKKREINVLFKNESLLAWDSQASNPLLTAPNLISYLIEFPPEAKDPVFLQWTYSNGDLQDINTKYPDMLAKADIMLVLIGASKSVMGMESELHSKRLNQLAAISNAHSNDTSNLQQSYQNVLREIGYYGCIKYYTKI
jgi:Uncharacterized conserved protein